MAKIKRTISLDSDADRTLTREARRAGLTRSAWLSLLLHGTRFDISIVRQAEGKNKKESDNKESDNNESA